MTDKQEFWFAARTKKDQEIATRNLLIKMNIEHFLPTRVTVRQLKYRKKKVEVPVIRNIIFIHASKEVACSLPNDFGLNLFYIRDYATHTMLVVPDKQMNDFMFVMDLNPDGVCVDDTPLQPGDKVLVLKGDLRGVEGELIHIDKKTHVVVRILNLVTWKASIPKSYLKKI
ncbi:UpxY family transcription antiterminator [Bacteroides sp. 519]|uniref:UpxY family transcription antiterminator n=1 Tax=Bacteroides sp. 519 TaxID=2302937 RepID=UPI0013D2C135|nr:UpxY family transcription antiterminator [Bacteroides sp. 519]NDV57779.1 UpxY family transcription antiterminator [Bacteroides sp. 519]